MSIVDVFILISSVGLMIHIIALQNIHVISEAVSYQKDELRMEYDEAEKDFGKKQIKNLLEEFMISILFIVLCVILQNRDLLWLAFIHTVMSIGIELHRRWLFVREWRHIKVEEGRSQDE